MTDLVVVGLSHHTAPVEIREAVALDKPSVVAALAHLRSLGFREVACISTCNRVEVYGVSQDAPSATEHLMRFFADRHHGSPAALYVHHGGSAVRHAFRVAASLDSMVVGEPQILGQFKEAFEAAQASGAIGTLLDRCFTRSFAVAKRIRSETGIAEGMVSISSMATSLARKIFGELDGRKVLLLGAGEMGEAAARSLAGSGAQLTVINRSSEKAQALAREYSGRAAGYEHLASELLWADVVICSTSSSDFVLTAPMMKEVVRARRNRPLFIIDIAVPRDVDPRVGDLDSIFLYDVDDLQKAADENLAQRRKAALAAEQIVEHEVSEFETWRRSLELTPTIVALRTHIEQTIRDELAKQQGKLGIDNAELDRLASSVSRKLLHRPLSALKAEASDGGSVLVAATQALFELTPARTSASEPSESPAAESAALKAKP